MKNPRPGVSAGRKSKPVLVVPAKKAPKKKPVARKVEAPFDPSLPLKKTEHEAVVQFMLKGLNQTNAYLAVFGGAKLSAEAHGARLVGNGKVKARLEWLKAQVAAVVVKETGIDQASMVRWCQTIMQTPVTLVAHAVAKHQLILLAGKGELAAGGVKPEPLTDEEEVALALAHELTPSDYGTKVKMVGKMDSAKMVVEILGLKKADEDANKNGQGIVDGLAALAAAVRSRSGGGGVTL
jgi:hypothetical protein